MPFSLFVLVHLCSSFPVVFALPCSVHSFPSHRFEALWLLWGVPPDAGLCRADPGGSFPWDPLPSAARKGAAGWPGGRRCPPGVSAPPAHSGPSRLKSTRRGGSGSVEPSVHTPDERQGLRRERSPSWPTLVAETAGLVQPGHSSSTLSPFLICTVPDLGEWLTYTWLSERGDLVKMSLRIRGSGCGLSCCGCDQHPGAADGSLP